MSASEEPTNQAPKGRKVSVSSFPALGKLKEAGTTTSTAEAAPSGSCARAAASFCASWESSGITISRLPVAKAVMAAPRIGSTTSLQRSGVTVATSPGSTQKASRRQASSEMNLCMIGYLGGLRCGPAAGPVRLLRSSVRG